jgi:hypothetical protein
VYEKGSRPVYLIIILKGAYVIVLRKSILQLVIQCVIGHVPDPQHIYASPVQAVAELCAGDGICR